MCRDRPKAMVRTSSTCTDKKPTPIMLEVSQQSVLKLISSTRDVRRDKILLALRTRSAAIELEVGNTNCCDMITR